MEVCHSFFLEKVFFFFLKTFGEKHFLTLEGPKLKNFKNFKKKNGGGGTEIKKGEKKKIWDFKKKRKLGWNFGLFPGLKFVFNFFQKKRGGTP